MPSRWLQWTERLPLAAHRPAVGYAFAILASVAGLALRFLLFRLLGHQMPFFTFFPSIILTAFLFGAGSGIFAGIFCWFLARWFVIEPLHSVTLTPLALGSILPYAVIVLLAVGIIHLMQRANRLLREQRESSLRRTEMREAMFHELQHRISNKLQLVASLLTLQRRTVVDPDAQKALEEAALRVGMIGRISRALHDPDRQGLGIAAFLEQVGNDIIEASGAQGVHLTVDAEAGIEFADDAGVPIALILAETISNTLEHGFGPQGKGKIDIAVRRSGGRTLLITVADDGRGVAPDFDAAQSPSLGLRIATTLARQLNGSYRLMPRAQGAIARLEVEALSLSH